MIFDISMIYDTFDVIGFLPQGQALSKVVLFQMTVD